MISEKAVHEECGTDRMTLGTRIREAEGYISTQLTLPSGSLSVYIHLGGGGEDNDGFS
jgi:hypothetical protein